MAKKKTSGRKKPPKLKVMVSSSVYGIEDLLRQTTGILEGFGYEVWMSREGTIPVHPGRSNFANCLEAVDRCDVFIGIITGWYGSGVASGELGITHQEVLRAIEKDKLRWFLVHYDVRVARLLLKQFRFLKDGKTPRKRKLVLHGNPVISDVRVLEMYESAARYDVPLPERTGNWVQEYATMDEATKFIDFQFQDVEAIRGLLEERNERQRKARRKR